MNMVRSQPWLLQCLPALRNVCDIFLMLFFLQQCEHTCENQCCLFQYKKKPNFRMWCCNNNKKNRKKISNSIEKTNRKAMLIVVNIKVYRKMTRITSQYLYRNYIKFVWFFFLKTAFNGHGQPKQEDLDFYFFHFVCFFFCPDRKNISNLTVFGDLWTSGYVIDNRFWWDPIVLPNIIVPLIHHQFLSNKPKLEWYFSKLNSINIIEVNVNFTVWCVFFSLYFCDIGTLKVDFDCDWIFSPATTHTHFET